MALTEKQKHKVIFYLGWAGRTIISGSTHFNSVVNDRLNGTNTEMESLVKTMLENLEKLDERLKAAQCRASTVSVGDITLNNNEIALLKKERTRLIRELSDHLDIPIMKSGGANASVVV